MQRGFTDVQKMSAAAVESVESAGSDKLRPVILLGLLAGCANLYRFRSGFYVMDDSWISFRIARNWVEHGVLTYDIARAPVEGMTNLLWTLLSAAWIAAWPEADPAVPARCLGAVLYLATLLLVARIAHREALRIGGQPVVAAAVTLGLCAISTSLAYYALSGLETALFGFLFVAGLDRYALAIRGSIRSGLACGVVLGLLAMTRPEGVAVAGVLCGYGILARDRIRPVLAMIAPCAVIILSMEAFRWLTYGELVPNTFFAKPPATGLGLRYAWSFWLFALGVVGPMALLPLWRRTTPFVRVLGAATILLAAGSIWSGGDWMPGFRRLTLPTLGAYLLIGIGASLARDRMKLVAGTAVAAIALGSVAASSQIQWTVYNTPIFGALGRLAEQTEDVDEVALLDIGSFGWNFRGQVFDLAGLTDSHLAKLPGRYGAKQWDEAYFRERSPDLVLVIAEFFEDGSIDERFDVRFWDRAILRSMVVGGGYRYHDSVGYMEGTKILIFSREDVDLPESIWGPASGRDVLGELRVLETRLANGAG